MALIILILAIFFALNMGGASFAASFATSYGGRIIDRRIACLLFLFFVTLGAITYGEHVTQTLGKEVVPQTSITAESLIVIFLSAGLSMYSANLMKIPQSTSLVTVAAMAGVGLYHHNLNMQTVYFFIPFWIILPILCFAATYFIAGYTYPPRKQNFWIYEKLVNHQARLKKFVIVCSCYNAFSVGTNNVANVVGPILGYGNMGITMALLIFACVYGLGGLVFPGTLKTAGERIVPLGLLTASIISLVSGTLMILASSFGIPQSFVMLQMGALFAIAMLKNGLDPLLKDPIAKKTLLTWTVNPVITLFVSYGLCYLTIKR